MSEASIYKSRSARLTCSAEEFYDFVTDVRNFERFISADTFSNLKTEKSSLNFQVNVLGTVNLSITERTMYNKVVYKGETRQVKDFFLIMDIMNSGATDTDVTVTLQADLNPMLKILADSQVKRFLETLVEEMEKFKGWRDTKARSQPL